MLGFIATLLLACIAMSIVLWGAFVYQHVRALYAMNETVEATKDYEVLFGRVLSLIEESDRSAFRAKIERALEAEIKKACRPTPQSKECLLITPVAIKRMSQTLFGVFTESLKNITSDSPANA
jgi:hypothetical protein